MIRISKLKLQDERPRVKLNSNNSRLLYRCMFTSRETDVIHHKSTILWNGKEEIFKKNSAKNDDTRTREVTRAIRVRVWLKGWVDGVVGGWGVPAGKLFSRWKHTNCRERSKAFVCRFIELEFVVIGSRPDSARNFWSVPFTSYCSVHCLILCIVLNAG